MSDPHRTTKADRARRLAPLLALVGAPMLLVGAPAGGSLTGGAPRAAHTRVPTAGRPADERFRAFRAPGDTFDVLAFFKPSGWMGDGAGPSGTKHVSWNDGWLTGCHSAPPCVRVTYTPGGQGWAGMYLQNADTNWGHIAGKDMRGYRRISFWAKADPPGVVEFKAGGIYRPDRPYKDSFETSIGVKVLNEQWKRFEIDLSTQNLSSVIGGFAWTAKAVSNSRGLTFFLDDVNYEK